LAVGDPVRLQRFRLTMPASVKIERAASVRLYAAPAGGLLDSMNVTVALVECTGSSLNSCNVVASTSSGFIGLGLLGPLWQAVDFDLGVIDENISASHALEVWVVADASSSRDLWLAYDANAHPSALTLT
jgi:hypothetical protein